jgi:hypothetical protein
MDKEKIEDLKVLLEMLLVKDEYIYTEVLGKINDIIEPLFLDIGNIPFSIAPYTDLKLNIYLDLKVGLSHLTRKIQPPYIVDADKDLLFHTKEYKSRFRSVLRNIKIANTLYGVLSNVPNINWKLAYDINEVDNSKNKILITT